MKQNDNCLRAARVLSIFKRLNHGEVIRKNEEVDRFHVTAKSIQRDFEAIRRCLDEPENEGNGCKLIYSRCEKGYMLNYGDESRLNGSDILAIAKVLLESRAFCKEELGVLLTKLLVQASSAEQGKIKEFIRNEKFHYTPVRHGQCLIQNLWTLSQILEEQRLVRIDYQKENEEQPGARVVEPQGIIFSEYYFYLVAYIHDAGYAFPAIYRMDRIKKIEVLNEHYSITYNSRFQEGEFRKRVQFMQPGPLMRIRFKYWGKSLDAVMDRLPTARIISQEEKQTLIEAEVYGKGIKMWLLSQAEYLEVVGPTEFREEMKRTIGEMAKLYGEENK